MIITAGLPLRKILNKNAIPSIFEWSKETKPRRALKRKNLSSATPEATETPSAIDEPASDNFCVIPINKTELSSVHNDEKDMKIAELMKELESKTSECESLKMQVQLEKFGVNRCKDYDKSMIEFLYLFSKLCLIYRVLQMH